MRKITLLTLALGSYVAVSAQAATNSAQHTVSVVLAAKIDVAVDADVLLDFSSAANFQDGVESASNTTVTVNSNKNFNLTIKTAAANFSHTTSTTTMPSSILGWKESAAASYTAFSGATAANVQTGVAKGANKTFLLKYQANPGYAYDPDTYTIAVVYTATQQ